MSTAIQVSRSDIIGLCRLCLAKDLAEIDIFETGSEYRQLFTKIVTCLPVEVTQNEDLPTRICEVCNSKVDNFYQFWTSTAKNQKQLQEWLKTATDEIKKTDITTIKVEADDPRGEDYEPEDYDDDHRGDSYDEEEDAPSAPKRIKIQHSSDIEEDTKPSKLVLDSASNGASTSKTKKSTKETHNMNEHVEHVMSHDSDYKEPKVDPITLSFLAEDKHRDKCYGHDVILPPVENSTDETDVDSDQSDREVYDSDYIEPKMYPTTLSFQVYDSDYTKNEPKMDPITLSFLAEDKHRDKCCGHYVILPPVENSTDETDVDSDQSDGEVYGHPTHLPGKIVDRFLEYESDSEQEQSEEEIVEDEVFIPDNSSIISGLEDSELDEDVLSDNSNYNEEDTDQIDEQNDEESSKDDKAELLDELEKHSVSNAELVSEALQDPNKIDGAIEKSTFLNEDVNKVPVVGSKTNKEQTKSRRKWTKDTNVTFEIPDKPIFYEPSTINLLGQTIHSSLDAFYIFFTLDLCEHIVEQTNLYAAQKGHSELNLTKEEFDIFIGILLMSCTWGSKRREMYWHQEEFFDGRCPRVYNNMEYDRFETILRYLHFADNTKINNTDLFYKVRPLFDNLNRNFKVLNMMDTDFVIDESVLPYYGRQESNYWRHEFGFRLWCLGKPNGYLLHVEPDCARLPTSEYYKEHPHDDDTGNKNGSNKTNSNSIVLKKHVSPLKSVYGLSKSVDEMGIGNGSRTSTGDIADSKDLEQSSIGCENQGKYANICTEDYDKSGNMVTKKKTHGKALSKDVYGEAVLELCKKTNVVKGTRLYFNENFTSKKLLDTLTNLELGATGGLDKILKETGLEDDKEFEKKPFGTMEFCSLGNIQITRWNFKGANTVMTNCIPTHPFNELERYSKREMKCAKLTTNEMIPVPYSIYVYNQNVFGIRKNDQFMLKYPISIRTHKWWWQFFTWSIDVCCVQAWLLYKQITNEQITLLEFKNQLTLTLLPHHESSDEEAPDVQSSDEENNEIPFAG